MQKTKSRPPNFTKYSRKHTAKTRMKRTPSKTAKERSDRYSHVLALMRSKLLRDHPNSAVAPHPSCRLGREPRQRSMTMCSVCNLKIDLEIDRAVARLVANGTFDGTSGCPYRV